MTGHQQQMHSYNAEMVILVIWTAALDKEVLKSSWLNQGRKELKIWSDVGK